MIVQFAIKGDPVPKGRPRVTFRGRKPRTYTPARTASYEQAVALAAKVAMRGAKPHIGFVSVRLSFTVRRMRSDIDNFAKTFLDAMNGVVYVDDCQVVHLEVTKTKGIWPGAGCTVMRAP